MYFCHLKMNCTSKIRMYNIVHKKKLIKFVIMTYSGYNDVFFTVLYL